MTDFLKETHHQYWPDESDQANIQHGPFKISIREVVNFSDYILRVFEVFNTVVRQNTDIGWNHPVFKTLKKHARQSIKSLCFISKSLKGLVVVIALSNSNMLDGQWGVFRTLPPAYWLWEIRLKSGQSNQLINLLSFTAGNAQLSCNDYGAANYFLCFQLVMGVVELVLTLLCVCWSSA